ncbi:MATE family efflux transporter [Clostridium sp. DL1XJH146]
MQNTDLTQDSIIKHIRKIAIPSGIGLLFNTLFNVVDTFYAGKINTEALAGLTISLPIFFIVIGLSSGLGNGTTALAAISIGEKDNKKLHDIILNSFFISFILSILIIVAAPVITPFLFKLSGSDASSMSYGIPYTKTIFYGAAFFIINSILNGILSGQGDTKSYRNFLIIGFFLNLILDPLFLYGWFTIPKLGTIGIGLATVIIQIFGTIYLCYRLTKSTIVEWKKIFSSKISFSTIKNILKQSIPSALNMVTVSIGVFVINYFILYYSNSSSIAGYGAAIRVEQLSLLPALGLNIAVLTITGQNYGAKNYERIKETKKIATIIGISIMIIGAIIIYPLAPFLIKLFNNDINVIEAGTIYLRIEVFAFPTYVLLNIATSTLQGIKKPSFAAYIGLYRQILMPIILFYFLGNHLNLGVLGVWWGIVIINWSAVIITLWYSKRQLNKL